MNWMSLFEIHICSSMCHDIFEINIILCGVKQTYKHHIVDHYNKSNYDLISCSMAFFCIYSKGNVISISIYG